MLDVQLSKKKKTRTPTQHVSKSEKEKLFNREIKVFKEALHIEKQKYGVNDPRFAETIHSMAIVYRDNSKYDDAMVCLQWKLRLLKAAKGAYTRERAVDIAATLTIMGNIHRRKKKLMDAAKYYAKSLYIFKAAGFSDDHPQTCLLIRLITRVERELNAGLSGKIRKLRGAKSLLPSVIEEK